MKKADISRRQFVLAAGAAGGALCLPGLLTACNGGGGEVFLPGTDISAGSNGAPASAQSLRAMVQKMVDFGPRLTGSPAHKAFLNYLEDGFQQLGMQVIRDPCTFNRWQARDWSLEMLDGDQATPIDVAWYYPYSGSTPEEGITGDLVSLDLPLEGITANITDPAALLAFLDDFASNVEPAIRAAAAAVPGGVKDTVLMLNGIIPPLLTTIFLPFLSYAKADDLARVALGDYKRAWLGLFTLRTLIVARELGAAGAIFVLDASPENARGQYLPFSSPLDTVPALLVDREVGATLRQAAASRPQVRLKLTADTFEDATTDSLVAILPGASDENMIVNTHTDGQNAFEENGAVACLAIARHYAAIPKEQRPRTLVFSLVTGHMGPNLPQTQGFVDRFPDLIKKAACGVTIEHFGATEWLDDENGYHATGNSEFAAGFHSVTKIGQVAANSYRDSDLTGVALLRPIATTYFGVGAPLHQAGVPSIGYLAGPNYLVTISDDGEMSKLDPERMELELAWIIDTLHRLETVPAAELKRGVQLPGI